MKAQSIRTRHAPIDIQPEEFRALGYQLIDRITEFMTAPIRRSTTARSPSLKE